MNTGNPAQIAYADCFSGISGDMFLGGLVDAGLDPDLLLTELGLLNLEKFTIQFSKHQDQAISCTRMRISSADTSKRRSWKNIRGLIENSDLKENVKERSLAVFKCLAEAEARIHDCNAEDVHFHEIGALDSIIDIVGTIIGLDYLGIGQLITSPLPMPRGWIQCDHGMLPLPAPAVCEILRDVPVYGVDTEQELVTPTGAAIVKTLSRDFGRFPAMKISRTGYGAGSRELQGGTPNLFRLVIGTEYKADEAQEVEVIETNLDDWSPETWPHVCEQLFAAGALDVSLTPVHMKKGRPGFLLSVIAPPGSSLKVKECILGETTSIGLRYRCENRMTLPRETGTVNTTWGPVQVKRVESLTGYVLYPEYEDCRRLALEFSVPIKDVYAAVNRCSADDFEKSNRRGE